MGVDSAPGMWINTLKVDNKTGINTTGNPTVRKWAVSMFFNNCGNNSFVFQAISDGEPIPTYKYQTSTPPLSGTFKIAYKLDDGTVVLTNGSKFILSLTVQIILLFKFVF